MAALTDQNEPLMFASSSETVGVSWRGSLGDGETPGRAVRSLLQAVRKALADQFSGRAVARLDAEDIAVTLTLRIPEPDGSTKVCEASVSLLVDDLTSSGDAQELAVVPRIRVGIHRLKDDLRWLARDADADVDALAAEIQDALLTVSPWGESS
jgi:hypothetical protein